MKYAIISTEKGDMKAELYAEETPITVDNFDGMGNATVTGAYILE